MAASMKLATEMYYYLTWYRIIIAVISAYLIKYFWVVVKVRATLPPGPFPYPIIGNPLGKIAHLSLNNLAKKYGDIMTVFIGSRPVVVISGGARIRECLLRHPTAFAGRPDLFLLKLIDPADNLPGITGLKYCPHLKLYRKLSYAAIRNFLADKHSHNYEELVSTEAKRLIARFSSSNGKPFVPGLDITATLADIALVTLCGSDNVKNYIDRSQFTSFLRLARKLSPTFCFNNVLDIFRPIGHIVETLNNIFVSADEKLLRSITKLLFVELQNHRATFNKDNIRDIIDAMINAKEEAEIEDNMNKTELLCDRNIVGAMADMFGAGITTTSSFIEWYLLYMIAYPDIQQKVHDELENVIGNDRYPTLKDRESLPYLQATILECLRLSSTVPLVIPHETIKNVKLNDYTIPSKTMIWINMWSVHHDEKLWPDPFTFRPERHLNSDGTVKSTSPNLMPFSCGARVCVGETFAKSNMYIILSHLLHHYKFKKCHKNQELDLSTKPGFVSFCKLYEFIATRKLTDDVHQK